MPQNPVLVNADAGQFASDLRQITDALPNRISIDPESVEQGLAKLVLTLIEFVRRLLEAQAVRRMEGSDLTPQQIEDLGLALMKLEERMKVMKEEFGLTDQDLNLDLGPIGRLI
jgi:hypothetical protein